MSRRHACDNKIQRTLVNSNFNCPSHSSAVTDVRGPDVKWRENIHPFTVLCEFSCLTCKLRFSSGYAYPWISTSVTLSVPEFPCTSELHPLRRMRLGRDRIGIFQKSFSMTWTLQEILVFLIPCCWYSQLSMRIV